MSMFNEINKYKIKVHDSNKNELFYIPNVISIDPLNNLFMATEWLVAEASKDYIKTHKTIEKRRKNKENPQKNLDIASEFSIRLGSRTQGYVNQLCLMEDILTFEYKRMADILKEATGGKIVFNPKIDCKNIKMRFSPIRTFRHKVVAHTAYTYPKRNSETKIIEDSPETIVRSILNLFPTDGEITVGNNFFCGFSKYKSEIPVISIFEWENKIKPIFEDWKRLFIGKLSLVCKKCPIENRIFCIKIANRQLYKERNIKE